MLTAVTFKNVGLLLCVLLLCESVLLGQQRVGAATQPLQPAMEQNTPQTATTSSQPAPDMVIGPGDLLEISVFGAPESTKQVRVSSEGTITYPFAGTMKLAEMTVRQAEAAVAKKLEQGGYYNNPTVSVLVKEYATTQGVSVLGEVQKPGIYPFLGPRQLFDAISAAGGLTPRAGKTIIISHRGRADTAQTLPLNDDPKNNVTVYPGDTISVSKAGIVYVVGNVRMPGGFVMENPDLSVLQAVALAQGILPDSSPNGSRIIRKGANGQQEIPVRLKDVLSSKAPDMKLMPDDILFVPASRGASAARRGLEAALQTVTGLAIYRRY